MTKMRTETDSFGPLEVPADKYYGAQTARSLINFPIGIETMPPSLIRALGIIKRSAALTNKNLKNLDAKQPTQLPKPVKKSPKANSMTTSRFPFGRRGQAHNPI